MAMWANQPFDVVSAQVDVGLLGMRDTVHAIEKVVAPQTLLKQAHKHGTRSSGPQSPRITALDKDKMKNFAVACSMAQHALADIQKAHQNLHSGLSPTFVDPLRVFYKKNQVIRKKIESQINKERANLKATLEQLEKERVTTQSQMEMLMNSKNDKVQKKVFKQLQTFEKRMESARMQHHVFYNKSLPKALADLEDTERARLGLLHAHLEHYHDQMRHFAENVQASAMGLQAAISELDVERDIKICSTYWDSRYKEQQQPPEPPLNPFPSSSSLAKHGQDCLRTNGEARLGRATSAKGRQGSGRTVTAPAKIEVTAPAKIEGLPHPRRLSQPTCTGRASDSARVLNGPNTVRMSPDEKANSRDAEPLSDVEANSRDTKPPLSPRSTSSSSDPPMTIEEEQDSHPLFQAANIPKGNSSYKPSYAPPARRPKQYTRQLLEHPLAEKQASEDVNGVTPTCLEEAREDQNKKHISSIGIQGIQGGGSRDMSSIGQRRLEEDVEALAKYKSIGRMSTLETLSDPDEVKVRRTMKDLAQRGRKNYRASVMSPIHMHLAGLVQDVDLAIDLSDDDEGDEYDMDMKDFAPSSAALGVAAMASMASMAGKVVEHSSTPTRASPRSESVESKARGSAMHEALGGGFAARNSATMTRDPFVSRDSINSVDENMDLNDSLGDEDLNDRSRDSDDAINTDLNDLSVSASINLSVSPKKTVKIMSPTARGARLQ